MRSLLSRALLAFALLAPAFAKPAAVNTQHQLNSVDDALKEPAHAVSDHGILDGPAAGSTNSEALPDSNNTIFNGMEVPPMKELTGEGIEAEIKNGYWFIKHFSPYCHHCKAIAPTWQTLYEYYYTSKPVPAGKQPMKEGDSMNSFTRYYDFNFASLDCIAYGDACNNHEIGAFPTFSVYKDGAFVKKFEEKKDMQKLGNFVESMLETIRPGSRSPDGVKFPEPEAKSSPDFKLEGVSEKDEKKKKVVTGTAVAAGTADTTIGTGVEATGTGLSSAASKAGGLAKAPKKTPLKKPSGPANPNGSSVDLSQQDFQRLVTSTQDPWFIKFYAPWCHHCQALAPSWAQMGKEMQGNLNIGEVNCDKQSRLCKDVRVKAYPTIHFFRGGERVEYSGLRGLGDLVSYAKKALDVGGGVQTVDEAAFKKMEETEEVIFVYFYDHATTTEDFESLERLTLSLIGHAKLVKTDDKALADRFKISTWPRLLVSRDGRPTYYNGLAPRDMRDFRQVLGWMQKNWLPIVPEITSSNSREIMKGKYVVLAVLSRDRADEFVLAKREIKSAALDWMEKQTHAFELERQELRDAKQLRLEEAEDRNDERAKRAAKSIHIDIQESDKKQVGFAWVDGIFWERWIRTTYGISVKEGEKVIINDEDVSLLPDFLSNSLSPPLWFSKPALHPLTHHAGLQNRRYWDTTISGAYIVPSRTSILETIPKVISAPPKISSKSSTGAVQRVFFGFRGGLMGHPWLSLIGLVGVLIGVGVYRRGRTGGAAGKRRRGQSSASFFHLDGKEGLLNGGGYGKAD